MAIDIVSCSVCKTKNASHRTTCLKCGTDLGTLGREAVGDPVREPLLKRVGSLVKGLNTSWRWSVAALFVAVYFGLTWFFFGSSHPCGILEARQRPYFVHRYFEMAIASLQRAEQLYAATQQLYAAMLRRGYAEKETAEMAEQSQKHVDRALQDVDDAPKNAARDLHQRISINYTPAKCLWEALAWNPDPYKGSPPLRDVLKEGE